MESREVFATLRAMAPDSPPTSLVALKEERDKTIQSLTDAFSRDLFDVDEFERRIAHAHEATTREALVHLRRDLEPADGANGTQALTAIDREAQEALTQAQPKRKWVLSLLGGTERKGQWRVPKELHVGAMLGGCEVDFREALIAPGVTEVKVFAVLGGVELIVPPDVNVECEGFGLLGAFEGHDYSAPASDQRPTLRITGAAVMGGVEIVQRLPGESAKESRKRKRREQKALAAKNKDRS